MSLNGDILVMRNGRSTSQVSVYNYPEHLNPFYEDDQHKRLRFWQINKNNYNGSRRNSFSIGSLKDMWSFKSFRIKKKSSTLGINKTSESPPPLRREFEYGSSMTGDFLTNERRSRYSADSNNFPRNAPYRSSLQNMYDSTNLSGSGFHRNNQLRSTIQFAPASVGHSPHPHTRRYLNAESPQSQRVSDSDKGNIMHGSSQTSLISTNPFDTDNEENEYVSSGIEVSSKRKAKKQKRRAPPPPPPSLVTAAQTSDKEQTHLSERLHIEEESEIAHLAAAIESFVETARNSSPESEPKKTSTKPNTCFKSNGIASNALSSKTIKETSPTPENNKKKRMKEIVVTKPSIEVGHVECIHVHVDSIHTTPDVQEYSLVTSFRSENNKNSEKSLSKTPFTLTDPNARQQSQGSKMDSADALSTTRYNSSQTSTEMTQDSQHNNVDHTQALVTAVSSSDSKQKNTNQQTKDDSESSKMETGGLIKPPIAAKPSVEPRTKPKILKANKGEIKTDIVVLPDLENIDYKNEPEAPTSTASNHSGSLKIIESEEDLIQSSAISNLSTIDSSCFTPPRTVHASETTSPVEVENLHRRRATSHLEWKTSTLAPLEPKVPPEKRKSVRDIIESINRSQRLLNAAAHRNEEDLAAQLASRNEITQEVLISLPQISEPNNNLNKNFTCLDHGDQLNSSKIALESNDAASIEHFNKNSDATKLDNAEIFQKCKINKEIHDYSYREGSPTISNMDWNPVPKPKRTKNLSDI